MMRDFTLLMYRQVVEALVRYHEPLPFDEFLDPGGCGRRIVLRHDVDRRVTNAVACAEVLHSLGVRGSFYFRYPYTFSPEVMKTVASLGHEIGYHYEVMSKARGNIPQAVELFSRELAEYRRYFDVRTACMHGAPLSRWDNREIWKHARLCDFGLKGEPYLSLDFNTVLYLTDTGRTWNQGRYALRDKVASGYNLRFHRTPEVTAAARDRRIPDAVMVNFHPERWNDAALPWLLQLIGQRAKNRAKRVLISWRASP